MLSLLDTNSTSLFTSHSHSFYTSVARSSKGINADRNPLKREITLTYNAIKLKNKTPKQFNWPGHLKVS